MINQDNDTLHVEQQNTNQPETKNSKLRDAMTAKLLASAAAGLVAGAGASYAAEHLMGKPEEENQAQETPTEQQTEEPTVEERLAQLEENEHIREEQEQQRQQQEAERQRHEHQRQKNEESRQKPAKKNDDDSGNTPEEKHSDYLKEHDVKITSVEENTENGISVCVYQGTVDGHQAAFLAENGRVTTVIVDANDNGNILDDELVDLSKENITTQQMSFLQVSAPAPTHTMDVIAVQHDVDFQGENVDVAIVAIDDQVAAFVDVDQNSEVDVVIADENGNGNIDQEEVTDVRSSHIPMPTEDDIDGNLMAGASDDLNDYSNDEDVAIYDV